MPAMPSSPAPSPAPPAAPGPAAAQPPTSAFRSFQQTATVMRFLATQAVHVNGAVRFR